MSSRAFRINWQARKKCFSRTGWDPLINYVGSQWKKLAPWLLEMDYSDFITLVCKFDKLFEEFDVSPDFIPCTTYWAY